MNKTSAHVDGDLTAIRFDNWKMDFAQQTVTLAIWSEPLVHTRSPWLYNLRTDPCERADIDSNTYWDWYLDHAYLRMASRHSCRSS